VVSTPKSVSDQQINHQATSRLVSQYTIMGGVTNGSTSLALHLLLAIMRHSYPDTESCSIGVLSCSVLVLFFVFFGLKGLVHPKMKIMSLITHSHVVPHP